MSIGMPWPGVVKDRRGLDWKSCLPRMVWPAMTKVGWNSSHGTSRTALRWSTTSFHCSDATRAAGISTADTSPSKRLHATPNSRSDETSHAHVVAGKSIKSAVLLLRSPTGDQRSPHEDGKVKDSCRRVVSFTGCFRPGCGAMASHESRPDSVITFGAAIQPTLHAYLLRLFGTALKAGCAQCSERFPRRGRSRRWHSRGAGTRQSHAHVET
jgi:hypothetical protein